MQLYREKNREKLRAGARIYYKTNSEKIKQRRNGENCKQKRNAKERERRKTDSRYRLIKNLRRRFCRAIEGNSKSAKTLDLLGCEVDFLKQYLESKFKPGMSWNNYGEWQIDHIRPCASFNLLNEKEQELCFHFSNLQPLWKIDNLAKSDKTGTSFH